MIRRKEQFLDRIRQTPVWVWLTGIVSFSFLLKLLCWHMDPTVSRDGCLYIHQAQIWYDTGNFHDLLNLWPGRWVPPLPIYLMKCLMSLGLSGEVAGICLNLISGTFTPILVYGIAYEVTQKKNIAIYSALLIAVNPSVNALSIKVQRDMIYLFFIGSMLWLLTAGIRRERWGYWLCSGLFCGCGMLTRFETLEFLLILPLSLLILFKENFISWKKALCYAGVFFLSFSCLVTALSFLMHTQDYLFLNYGNYYQTKAKSVEQQFYSEQNEELAE